MKTTGPESAEGSSPAEEGGTDTEVLGSSPDAARSARFDPENWVRQHGNRLYRHALWRVRQPAIAEDIVQDTFLTAWKSRKRFRGDSSERAWLFGILKNKLLHHYRQERSDPSVSNWESLADPDAEAFQKTGWLQGWWTHEAPASPNCPAATRQVGKTPSVRALP